MDFSGYSRANYEKASSSEEEKSRFMAALESAIAQEWSRSCVALAEKIAQELNRHGHNLARVEEELVTLTFADTRPGDEPSLALEIFSTCGISAKAELPPKREIPPEEEWFFERLDPIFDKFLSQGYEALTAEEKYFHDVDQLDREVNNGGFSQYFLNSAGRNAHETLEALKTIGAKKARMLLMDAVSLFPGKLVPKDDAQREKLVDWIEKENPRALGKLDERYYKSAENMMLLLYRHSRRMGK